MADNVEHPAHYQCGGIETIDVIRAKLGEGFGYYCEGNAIKYLTRWRLKGGVEDLRKARVYLDWLIESEESAKPKGGFSPQLQVLADMETDPALLAKLVQAESDDGPDGLKAGEAYREHA